MRIDRIIPTLVISISTLLIQSQLSATLSQSNSTSNTQVSSYSKSKTDNFFIEGKLKLEKDSNYQGAIADFSRSLQLNPNNADTYFMRGKAHYHLGEMQEALVDLQKAETLCQQQRKTDTCRETQGLIAQVKLLLK
jgi:tetratricopeptide (TPR) repeat protein